MARTDMEPGMAMVWVTGTAWATAPVTAEWAMRARAATQGRAGMLQPGMLEYMLRVMQVDMEPAGHRRTARAIHRDMARLRGLGLKT